MGSPWLAFLPRGQPSATNYCSRVSLMEMRLHDIAIACEQTAYSSLLMLAGAAQADP